jgi:hypothetical protein
MKLIRIWSKKRGFIYDATKEGGPIGKDNAVPEKKDSGLPARPENEQLAFGFA